MAPGVPQAYDRSVWPYRELGQQQLQYSDFTNDRNIDLLVGNSDSESQWQSRDRKSLSTLEFLGSAWDHKIHIVGA